MFIIWGMVEVGAGRPELYGGLISDCEEHIEKRNQNFIWKIQSKPSLLISAHNLTFYIKYVIYTIIFYISQLFMY